MMKSTTLMKITIFLCVCGLILGFLYLYSKNGEPDREWQSWLKDQHRHGYDVLSVEASKAWIEKHKDAIHIPDQITFGELYQVPESLFVAKDTTIAVDPQGKYRVRAKEILTPEKVWQSWLRRYKDVLEYKVLSVEASEAWIEKHKDEIHIPDKIEFGNPHNVMELHLMTYQIKIAVDPTGNRRVAAREFPIIPIKGTVVDPLDEEGYLDEKESKEWLRNNGYQLSKGTDGDFILQYQEQRPGIDYKNIARLGRTIVGYPLKDGATLTYLNGKIRIKIK